jgi:ribosomal protein S18 acetylase RimI-like enzyme
MPPAGIVYRPKTDADRPFLRYVYATTRAGEMALVQWTPEQQAEFLDMQFNAQWSHYEQYYPDCAFLVIERDGHPIGRIYIDRTPEEICLVDIALLPEVRGAGLGTQLVQEILDEAQAAGKRVTIHVEHFNPAMHLYQRLGFEKIDETGVYYLMRWPAASKPVDQLNTAS